MRETTLKAKAIYERFVELYWIAKKEESDYRIGIGKLMAHWWNIYVNEEYQDLMNDADEVHKELQRQWDEGGKIF